MVKFRSVCGEPADIKETTSERAARLLVEGTLLYKAFLQYRGISTIEYTVVARHKREVYLYPTDPHCSYPGILIGWKSIVFNDTSECYFEHEEDAINMLLKSEKERYDRVSVCANKLLGVDNV